LPVELIQLNNVSADINTHMHMESYMNNENGIDSLEINREIIIRKRYPHKA